MNRWIPVAVAVVAATATWAAPFNPADVPAEVKWFAHVDVDQLKATQVGKAMLELLTTDQANRKLAALQTVFGFDPRKDLFGLTACGVGGRSAVIVRGRFDAERLVTLLRANDGYEEVTHEGCAIHSWIDEGKAKKQGADKARMYGAFHSSGAAVLSEQADTVGHVLAVLDGRKPATSARPVESGDLTPVMVGVVEDLASADPKNAALKLARGGTVILGETAGRVRGRVTLETVDASTASNLLKVAEGMKSALLLNAEKDPRAATLAASAAVALEGTTVSMKLEMPVEDIVKAIREEAAKKLEKKAE
jgi:hypothetical protein